MRILVGVDVQTEGHEWLVQRAGAFARQLRGTTDLVYVGGGEDAKLTALLELIPESERGKIVRESGDVVEGLLRAAASADVLVVGPREPGLLERMFRGPIASRVLRHAPCAVLVVRGEPRDRYRKALVGVDLYADRPVLPQAAVWAERLNMRLDATYSDVHAGDQRLESAMTDIRVEDRRLLDTKLSEIPAKVRGVQRYTEGTPEDALVELSGDYDIVIVGTAPRPGLVGPLLSSVAELLVRRAECDVLSLPTATL